MTADEAIDLVVKVMVPFTPIMLAWMSFEYHRRTGVTIDAQQIASVQDAMTTAAGNIRTKIDQGHMTVAEVKPDNPKVIAEVRASMADVPTSAAGQNLTEAAAARIVVGRVDTTVTVPVRPAPDLVLQTARPT